MYRQTFKIFAESNLNDYLHQASANIDSRIRRESDNYILNVNETEFVDYLLGELSIDEIIIDFENAFVTTYEKNIPAERFPRGFYVYAGKSYPTDVVVYHLPFSGDEQLLRMVPNSRLLWSVPVYIEDGYICFEIIAFRDDSAVIEREANDNIGNIKKQWQNVLNDIRGFNNTLQQRILESFRGRKQHLLKKGDFLAALSVPVKKKYDLPETFAVPPI